MATDPGFEKLRIAQGIVRTRRRPPPPPRVDIQRPDHDIARMETRLIRVEADLQELKTDLKKTGSELSEARVTLAGVSEKVGGLPTKDWVGSQFRNWIVGVGAFLGILTVAARFIGQ
jgi:hypothetical protein